MLRYVPYGYSPLWLYELPKSPRHRLLAEQSFTKATLSTEITLEHAAGTIAETPNPALNRMRYFLNQSENLSHRRGLALSI
jgi:hypothetical protein